MVSVGERREGIQAMRGQLWSLGRPSKARREDRVRFWEAIARGLSSEDAAGVAGVSSAVGSRWFRQAAGWVDRRRRFIGSCGGTRRLVVGMCFIGQRRRSGTPSGVRAARRFPSWLRMTSFGRYVQDRLGGMIAHPDGEVVPGPEVKWTGRRHGRRAGRRWATSWSPEQISNRLRIDFARQ